MTFADEVLFTIPWPVVWATLGLGAAIIIIAIIIAIANRDD